MNGIGKKWGYLYAPWIFYPVFEKIFSIFSHHSLPDQFLEVLVVIHVYILAAYLAFREFIFDYRFSTYVREEVEQSEIMKKKRKTALVTGGDGTIGREIVEFLINHDFDIIMLVMKDRKVFKQFQNVTVFEIDLFEKSEVLKVARKINNSVTKTIDIAVFAAGVMLVPEKFTPDGIEVHNCINVVSQLSLFQLLSAKINKSIFLSSATATVACFPSSAYEDILSFRAGPYQAYSTSKLILAVYVMEHVWKSGNDLNMVTIHPGTVPGGLYRHSNFIVRWLNKYILPCFMRTGETAALLVLHTLLRDDIATGQYYEDTGIVALMERMPIEDRLAIYKAVKERVDDWTNL